MDTKQHPMRDHLENKRYQKYIKSWIEKIPKINFDSDMDVVLRPPFGLALVRMQVDGYSIYLDVDGLIGNIDLECSPYRELYDGYKCHRFHMEDVEGLIDKIRELKKDLPINKNN